MFATTGYNFFADSNSMDAIPNNLTDIKSITIKNGVFDDLFLTRDVLFNPLSQIKIEWDYPTIMWATFDGHLHAGNVDFTADQVSVMRIKRRVYNEHKFITLFEVPIKIPEDFNFERFDRYNRHDTEYEYALVPVIGGIEGNLITQKIRSCFNGVFIADKDRMYKLQVEVSYGEWTRVKQVGEYITQARYPIYIENGSADFIKGSVTATIASRNIIGNYNARLRRPEEIRYRQELTDFLQARRPIILKDWNGNMWLVRINSNLRIKYLEDTGMGLASVTFTFGEVGSADNQQDMYASGLLDLNVEGYESFAKF